MNPDSGLTKANADKHNNERIYNVLTKDNEICQVSASVIAMSRLITTMLEDLNLQDDDNPIMIPNVSASVFRKIISWCEKHRDQQAAARSNVDKWDDEFFDMDHSMLFEIIVAANYLDIPNLLDDGCKRIAEMLRGKTPEQIRNLFNIANDFTQEEEAVIRRENAWCLE